VVSYLPEGYALEVQVKSCGYDLGIKPHPLKSLVWNELSLTGFAFIDLLTFIAPISYDMGRSAELTGYLVYRLNLRSNPLFLFYMQLISQPLPESYGMNVLAANMPELVVRTGALPAISILGYNVGSITFRGWDLKAVFRKLLG